MVVEVDRELAKILQHAAAAPALNALSVEDARIVYRRLAAERGQISPAVETRDMTIPGADGDLPARLYDPDGANDRDLLLFFHGGGFVMGDIETHDPLCRRLATRSRLRILSVAYRLGPEHPFPAAYDDGRAALDWALHTTSGRVMLGGDSAGANLALWTALGGSARGSGPAGLVLIYPNVAFSHASASRTDFASGYMLSADDLAHFSQQFLQGSDDRSLLDADLRGLPPTLLVTAGFDPLRDEGVALADAIATAGGAADHIDFPDMIHGFANMGHLSAAASKAVERVGDEIARRFGR